MKIITNKVIKVSGEDKELYKYHQIWIKPKLFINEKIYAKIKVPEINGNNQK